MQLDSATEAIAHFVGQFQIDVEEARLRQAYDEFRFARAKALELQQAEHHAPTVLPPLDLEDFTPSFRAFPGFEDGRIPSGHAPFDHPLPQVATPLLDAEPAIPHLTSGHAHGIVTQVEMAPPEPPGSTVLYANQHLELSDNDYASVGGSNLVFQPDSHADAQLVATAFIAEHYSPLSQLDNPTSPATIATFADEARSALDHFAGSHADDPDVTIVRGDTLEGAYVNGQSVDEVPQLSDYMPAQPAEPGKDGGDQDNGPSFVAGEGSLPVESSVKIDTGNNVVVNETHISNVSLGAAVIAVAQDNIELNAIVQTTAIVDQDHLGSQLQAWAQQGGPSDTFNIAQFDRLDPREGADAQATGKGVFPGFWSVTEIKGDLVFMNWVKQFAFLSDNDIVLASASGSQTSVVMGDNQSVNAASIADLGNYYDLILCGGSFYSINTISQISVLVDNDTVGAVSGFHSDGENSISTGDNLLWNSAGILNIGGADRFEAMPGAYEKTLADMGKGKMDVASGVLGDHAFEGLGAIRVLYVSGSIYNLNSIEQHAILSDSDNLALAMNAVAADPTANWTIVTGTNTLANVASITSLDAMGKTYVGGGHYSDAMLVQSGLVPSLPDLKLAAPNADALVNEAVAFLTDDAGAAPIKHETPSLTSSIAGDHHAQADIMHGVLS